MTTRLNSEMIAVVKRARLLGYYNHHIAAYYGVNQGRIAEINRGHKGHGIQPADDLPPDFPPLIH